MDTICQIFLAREILVPIFVRTFVSIPVEPRSRQRMGVISLLCIELLIEHQPKLELPFSDIYEARGTHVQCQQAQRCLSGYLLFVFLPLLV